MTRRNIEEFNVVYILLVEVTQRCHSDIGTPVVCVSPYSYRLSIYVSVTKATARAVRGS